MYSFCNVNCLQLVNNESGTEYDNNSKLINAAINYAMRPDWTFGTHIPANVLITKMSYKTVLQKYHREENQD